MNAIITSRHLGLLTVSLLLGFVGAVHLMRPAGQPSQALASARLQSAPQYRVLSDPLELAQAVTDPRGNTMSDVPGLQSIRDAAVSGDGTQSADATQPAGGAVTLAQSDPGGARYVEPESMGLASNQGAQSDPVIDELKGLGMAYISSPGNEWFTLQTAYVAAEDTNLLKRRVLEASNAVGSRDDVFVYSTARNGRQFNGVCVRRFESGTSAKAAKGRLDARLGYPSQVRSKKGLQKELGF